MKIAIITVFYNTNYGAVLQAYASTKIISEISGRECYLVDYRRNKLINMFRNSMFDVDITGNKKITKESIKRKIRQITNPSGTLQRFNNFEKFRDKYMSISDQFFLEGEDICLKNTDIVFLGSDQIWNPDITQGFNEIYFGRINNSDLFTISYAASLGKTEFSDTEKIELSKLLNCVDIISVREEEGAEILRQLTDRVITCVPDPTVLVDRNHWLEIATDIKLKETKYVLVYMLTYSQDIVDLAYKVSESHKCEIVLFDSGLSKPIKRMKQKKNYGPSEFLRYMAEAEFVITNSFHGTVFSVIFNKQFYTIPHKTKGSRMINFCRKLGLEDRIVYDSKEASYVDIEKNVDYKIVQPRLEELKKVGIDFIKHALEEANRE